MLKKKIIYEMAKWLKEQSKSVLIISRTPELPLRREIIFQCRKTILQRRHNKKKTIQKTCTKLSFRRVRSATF